MQKNYNYGYNVPTQQHSYPTQQHTYPVQQNAYSAQQNPYQTQYQPFVRKAVPSDDEDDRPDIRAKKVEEKEPEARKRLDSA